MNFVNQYKLGKNNEFTKRTNRATVLRLLRAHQTMTRADLVKMTSLTPQSISKIMAGLEKSGLIKTQEKIFGGKGQPPLPFSICPSAGFGVGVQLEKHTLQGALLNFDGAELASVSLTHNEHTSEGVLDLLRETVKGLIAEAGVPNEKIWGIGLATPRLSNTHFEERQILEDPFWAEFADNELERQFSQHFNVPVFSENDANAGALGESMFGGAQKIENFCYLYVSDGLGCGVFSGERLFRGAGGNAGEIGRVPISLSDPNHVVEDVLNQKALENLAALERLGGALRWLVSIIENAYDPSMIILGGEVETAKLEALCAAAQPLLPSIASRKNKRNPRLTVSEMGKNAVAWGSAMIPILGTIAASPSADWNYYGRVLDVYPH